MKIHVLKNFIQKQRCDHLNSAHLVRNSSVEKKRSLPQILPKGAKYAQNDPFFILNLHTRCLHTLGHMPLPQGEGGVIVM